MSSGPGRQLRARPVTASGPVAMPSEFQPQRLLRRVLQILAVIVLLGLVVLLAPGLGEVRAKLEGADPAWIALGVLFEALSCASYVLMFRPVFCRHMPWRTVWEIGLSELAMGSLVPASGAGGLALGAWILHEGGMPADRIARRSVAFFLLKSSVNFIAVVVIGTLMAVQLIGPHQSLALTALPAAAALLVILGVICIPRLPEGSHPHEHESRLRRTFAAARRALIGGTAEAIDILRSRNWQVILGSIGYWAWDNAVLWAAFHAFGASPPISIILMGYLIGQLGGLLPLPGGLGGIDAGLFGALVVYGTPVSVTAAAVLAYRVILFWLPLVAGTIAFVSLRRGLNDPSRPELCAVPAAT